MCNCESNKSMDMKTPRNVYLSAFYKRSFAFYTVKNRMPVILTNLVDDLVRNKHNIIGEYGEQAKEELKTVIGKLSELKYEIQTNKPLQLLTSQLPDAKIYNDHITKQTNEEGQPTHFHTIWLLTECYMYRRINQIFENTNTLKHYDYFRNKKEESFISALPLICQMGKHLIEVLNKSGDATREEFIQILKLNLWGNKCDLSLSLGKVSEHSTLFDTHVLDSKILCDQSEHIWNAVSNTQSSSDIIDIVLDNAGYEVFTDLCLADYLISKNLAKSVRIYVKTIPWFISDVMQHDLNWLILMLKQNSNEILVQLGEKWGNYIEKGVWTIVESDFWTLPLEFAHMPKVNPELYRQLAEAKIILFKGDLNYRKLFGEKNWDPATSVDDALNSFNPSKLGILRTVKADIICGLSEGLAEKIEASNPNWMETGDYGLIQFSDKIVIL
ncbi:damage-control phosphatase ARMT1 [Leptinotarsa decemlineata]|uniref:damage-control phosphatase ARMT1 n=1 Tax=Leptinotarsa decemlineata TaxID=7539 RepID=UPI003D305D18